MTVRFRQFNQEKRIVLLTECVKHIKIFVVVIIIQPGNEVFVSVKIK